MSKRSLKASPIGIKLARESFAQKGWTQEYLANEVRIKTRQPIWRFFAGRPVERHIFIEICKMLNLDWREIALDPPAELIHAMELEMSVSDATIDELVKKVRSQRQEKITSQCGILHLLDISRPVSIENVYVDVNILEEIASQQWLELSELDNLKPEDVDRYGLGKISDRQISGMQAVGKYSKLSVLGKPGSGKTTFLQYLAIQSNQGNYSIDKVPIFITLRDFAHWCQDGQKFDLLEYIHQEFLASEISDLTVLQKMLQKGRILFLLDGMDEVRIEDESNIYNEIRQFFERYYKNQVVVTCRTAAQKFSLQGFTDVEIAPFTQEQISAFARKWFITFSKTDAADGLVTSYQFMQKLALPENWRFRRLITTPLFLHLACWIFHRQDKFPLKQAEFYKQGLDLLLGKWDESRGLEREQVYRGFLLPQKLQLLSQIASSTFEQNCYFFEKHVVEEYIDDFMQTLPNANPNRDEAQQIGASVLRSIESQHGLLAERARGIFSFSYLALQEYLAARKIVASHNLQSVEQSLSKLVSHISDPHWREIFLLTTTMLRSADGLVHLMKQQIDALVSDDPYLQDFLTWASHKSSKTSSENKAASRRGFYLALSRTPHLAQHFALASILEQGMLVDASLDNLLQVCSLSPNGKDVAYVHACGDALSNILGTVIDLGFHKALQQLSDRLPNSDDTKIGFERWCHNNYAAWADQLHQIVTNHLDIDREWQFTLVQQQVLQRYYAANQLLLDCLNSNCEVTAVIRQEIEATLLLPQKELNEREWK